MALQSIKPQYKKWINELMTGNMETSIFSLNKEFNDNITNILHNKKSDQQIKVDIDNIRNKLLYTNLIITTRTNDPTILNTLKTMSEKMSYINKYEERELLNKQKSSINVLTYINLIFLPLTLVTSYFGMNFYSMGATNIKQGIFGIPYSQPFVWFMGVISVFLLLILVNRFYLLQI
jgi:Mg2+ and Co2+ transporter CorA